MAFASTQDVGARLRRELDEAEEEQAELLLEQATYLIAEAGGKSEAWADSLDVDDVPKVLWALCVEMVVRGFDNPAGARSTQETLGQYSRSVSYRDGDKGGGLFLTDFEELRARRAIWGVLSGSAQLASIVGERDLLIS